MARILPSWSNGNVQIATFVGVPAAIGLVTTKSLLIAVGLGGVGFAAWWVYAVARLGSALH